MIHKKVRPLPLLVMSTVFAAACLCSPHFVDAQTAIVCTADINSDGRVDLTDYSILVGDFLKNPPSNPLSDINHDGKTDLTDYSILVSQFLKTCIVATRTPSPIPTDTITPSIVPSVTPISGAQIYVSPSGNNSNLGTSGSPVKTIQKGVDLAKASTSSTVTVLVAAGTYRENVTVADFTNTSKSVTISALNGANTVFVDGSESSKNLSWTKGTNGLSFPSTAQSHVYWADISAWNAIPENAYEVSSDQVTTSYPKAHEPDFIVDTPYKYHENWWTAEGGSVNTLVDNANDFAGSYPRATEEAGNLKSLNGFTGASLVGARMYAIDNTTGHDAGSAVVTAHNANTGTITLDKNLNYYTGLALIGAGTKYYIEGASQLLDTPGEWYVDVTTKRLYLWPKNDVDPSQLSIEFGVRPSVFYIKNSNNITLKDLTIQFSNFAYGRNYGVDGGVRIDNAKTQSSDNITLDTLVIRNNGVGIRIDQDTDNGLQTRHIHITNSQVLNSEGLALSIFHWPVSPVGVQDVIIDHTNFDTANYRALGNGDGLWIVHTKNVVFRSNRVAHMAHNGIEVQGLDNNNLLVDNNIFEDNCFNGYDCGGFKIYGGSFSMQNVLISHNIVRGTRGWSAIANTKNLSSRNGFLGFGMYSDNVFATDGSKTCPIVYYRNAIYDTSADAMHLTESRDHCVFNNISNVQSAGLGFNNRGGTHGYNTIVNKNIFYQAINTLGTLTTDDRGISVDMDIANQAQMIIDGNMYQGITSTWSDMLYKNSSGATLGTYKSVADIQNNTVWEDNGRDTTSGTFGLTNQTSYDISQIEQSFGMSSVSTPSEVSTLMNFLSQTLGVNITDSSTVGIL